MQSASKAATGTTEAAADNWNRRRGGGGGVFVCLPYLRSFGSRSGGVWGGEDTQKLPST